MEHATTHGSPLIQLKDVSKTYPGKVIFNRLTMSISPGIVLGIVGPNGAGKSTFVRAITGEIPFDSGSISVKGFPITDHHEKAKAALGYVPQETNVYPYLSIHEYLSFIASIRLGSITVSIQESMDQWLHQFRLWEDRHILLKNCSYGMIRKTQFIAALIGNPDVLILDEGLNGLDLQSLMVAQDLFKRWITACKSVLLVSHELEIIDQNATEVLIVQSGGQVEYLDREAFSLVKPTFRTYYLNAITFPKIY